MPGSFHIAPGASFCASYRAALASCRHARLSYARLASIAFGQWLRSRFLFARQTPDAFRSRMVSRVPGHIVSWPGHVKNVSLSLESFCAKRQALNLMVRLCSITPGAPDAPYSMINHWCSDTLFRHPGVEARTLTVPILLRCSAAMRSKRTTFEGSAKLGMARREGLCLILQYILSSRHGMHSRAGKGGDASHNGLSALIVRTVHTWLSVYTVISQHLKRNTLPIDLIIHSFPLADKSTKHAIQAHVTKLSMCHEIIPLTSCTPHACTLARYTLAPSLVLVVCPAAPLTHGPASKPDHAKYIAACFFLLPGLLLRNYQVVKVRV